MRIPNIEQAIVAEEKITHYLLNPAHPAGGSKASFFLSFGFSVEAWRTLADALWRHGRDNEVVASEETKYGNRYVVDGPLVAPTGFALNVRTAWFISPESDVPRFITAHPLPRQ